MKFSKLKLPKLPKGLVIGYLVALVVVIRFANLFITNRAQFWIEAPFLVSSIAAIFAGISALLVLRSLKMTKEALELTRTAMRPFLAVECGEVPSKRIKDIEILEFHLRNTGSIPGNLVTADIAFFDNSEVIEEDNQSKYYPGEHKKHEGVVVFPGAVYNVEQAFDMRTDISNKLIGNMTKGKVKLRFRVIYRAQGVEYVTVQTEAIRKEMAGAMTRVPIQPQRWT